MGLCVERDFDVVRVVGGTASFSRSKWADDFLLGIGDVRFRRSLLHQQFEDFDSSLHCKVCIELLI